MQVFGGPLEGLPVVVVLAELPVAQRMAVETPPISEKRMRDGSVLAAVESVVVVTVNYRRDVFGEHLFLAFGPFCVTLLFDTCYEGLKSPNCTNIH